MNIAVVPAQNEQGRIGKVLTLLDKAPLDKIIVVVNGSGDNTLSEIRDLNLENVEVINFEPKLGIDIPRAVGAYAAFLQGAVSVVFVDGDMIGEIQGVISRLIYSIICKRSDLAMTDCYPTFPYGNRFAEQMLSYRKLLNTELGIYHKINVASPSHGPHAVSRRLMETADFRDFAVPPMILAFAVKNSLRISVPASVAQVHLGSKVRDYYHAKNITDTVTGDTIEALNYFQGKPRIRRYLFKDFQGYNPGRRFDILEEYLSK